jgi:Holliday junction resolvasome RuvABC endonuclease subunit
MITPRRYDLVLAVYPYFRGIAFVLFEGFLAPVDWGVHDVRGPEKNARCLERVSRLFSDHAPDVLVLEDMSDAGTYRSGRVRALNSAIRNLADMTGLAVNAYSRTHVRNCFAKLGRTTKSEIAELIGKHVPALDQYVPPIRKLWKSEDARMGLFDAAALAWTFFHNAQGDAR